MKIHFIGIGGISMSALAEICINKGYQVSGSDMNESYLLEEIKVPKYLSAIIKNIYLMM